MAVTNMLVYLRVLVQAGYEIVVFGKDRFSGTIHSSRADLSLMAEAEHQDE